MTKSLYKFPSTPHLADLSATGLRSDKVLTVQEAEQFLTKPIVVEEKVDGANLGVSLDPAGNLQFQNRGSWLDAPFSGQWTPLREWAGARQTEFRHHLPDSCVLFGEWCYAEHSIAYDQLPDWFIGFDVFDLRSNAFWSHQHRNKLLAQLNLSPVPILSQGLHNFGELQELLRAKSRWGDLQIEGIYLRREADGFLQERAKLVSPDFSQQISKHWSRKPIRHNRIAYAFEHK